MSTEYIFIEMIFLNEYYTLEEAAESLQISPSTLRRIIKKINKTLEKESIEISLLPLKITGNEARIYNFLTHYLLEKYIHDEDFPFSPQQKNALDTLLNSFEQVIINISYADLRRLRIYTIIRLIRIQNNNLINFGDTSLNSFIKLPMIKNSQLETFFKETLHIKLTEQNIMQLFPIFSTGAYAFSYAHLCQLGESNDEYKNVIQHFSKIIENLSNTFKVKQQNKEKIILELYNVYMLQYGKPFVLYSMFSDFTKHIRSEYPNSLKLIETAIKKEFSNETIQSYSFESYIYILVTNWENLYLEMSKNVKRIKLGIFYNTGIEHMLLVKEQIIDRLPNYFQIEIIKHNNISVIRSAFEEHTVLLTNIPGIEVENTTVFCFPINVRETDWDKLMKFHSEFHATDSK